MKHRANKPSVLLEGIVYAEVSAWITIAGMLIAIVGLLIVFIHGGRLIDEAGLLRDMFGGLSEALIWTRDSTFHGMPEEYWFFRQRLDGDELSMFGLVVACYGGVAGVWALVLSMLRKREPPVQRGRLYLFLAGLLAVMLTLAGIGVITLH